MYLDTRHRPKAMHDAHLARIRRIAAGACFALFFIGPAPAADTSAALQLERWSQEAGAAGQAERGRAFFTNRHGGEWSCASCHGSPPTTAGKHASTGKAIDAMAPAVNAKAFTDSAKTDKWFRRNCNDVLQRTCSASEKADVLAYLISLRP